MVNHQFVDSNLRSTQDTFNNESGANKLSIRKHITAFHLLQCVALRLESAYEMAKTKPSEVILSQILLGEQQFDELFNQLFQRHALGKPYYKDLVEAVCDSARATCEFTQISTLIN